VKYQKYDFIKSFLDRALAQAVGFWSFTMEAWFQSQVISCETCSGKSGNWTVFSPSTSVFPCQYHIASAPYSFNRLSLTSYNLSSLWCHYI